MRPTTQQLLEEYASWRIRNESRLSGFPPVTLLYRILKEGTIVRAASSGMRYLYIPTYLLATHQAWESAPLKLREALEARYMEPGADKPKAIALGISIGELRRRHGLAQVWVEAWLEAMAHGGLDMC